MFLNLKEMNESKFESFNEIDAMLEMADLCIAVESAYSDLVIDSCQIQITVESVDEQKTGFLEKVKTFFKRVIDAVMGFFKSMINNAKNFSKLRHLWIRNNMDIIKKLDDTPFYFKSSANPVLLHAEILKMFNFDINTNNIDKTLEEIEARVGLLEKFKDNLDFTHEVIYKASSAKDCEFLENVAYLDSYNTRYINDLKKIEKFTESNKENLNSEYFNKTKKAITLANKNMMLIFSLNNILLSKSFAFVKTAVAAYKNKHGK